MTRIRQRLAGILSAGILALAAVLPVVGQQVPHSEPGPATDRLFFRAFDVDRAPRDLEAGSMDLYMFSLKTTAAERLRGNDTFQLYQAPASTVSLILNPAPAPQGQLNPFSIQQVRFAVQYLVDREFIAREIYRGLAEPMITHVSPQDPDYVTIFDIVRGSGIEYDPEYGRDLIAEAMRDAGARMRDGAWTYGGQPIRIRLIGRVEDERRDIADLVRTELERAGFTVAVSYRPFAAAVLSVYSTDPQAFEWHVYTEGWGRSAPQRYDFANANQMNAPWLGNMPGWQEVGFWQYANPEIDDLGKRLYRGEFRAKTERDEIYRRITEVGLEESVRVWLVTAMNTFPARSDLRNLSPDLVAGPRSPWTLREAYVQGKSELTVGHLWVWTERTTWNPVGGLGDVYSTDIWRYLNDPAVWNHPFTGIPMPVRVDYDVQTAGAGASLAVPNDAMTWSVEAHEWQDVERGTRATSKVVFDYSDYFEANWHHGQPIEMADLLYSIAQSYEIAYDPDKARIEVAISVTSRPFLETFRGYRVLDENRIEVYVDFWHFDENYIASYATPGSVSVPWEILAAMDDLVFNQRRAAYSDTAASRFNVSWISLVMDRDARMVDRTLRQYIRSGFVPEGYFTVDGRALVSESEAVARYEAAMDWFDETGHMVISNGPYFLRRYDPPAQFAELEAFRDPRYPYEPGDWYFGQPPELSIDSVEGTTIRAGRTNEVTVEASGSGELSVRYVLVDPATSEVVTQGEAERSPGGSFLVRLSGEVTGQLFPGLYKLSLALASDAIAVVSDRTVDIDIEP
jgi:peptide/nickel transport system substrate-binding protein